MLTLVNTCDWKYRKCRPLLITKSTPKLFTWDDVVSQRDKFGRHSFRIFLGSQKLSCFLNFPVSTRTYPIPMPKNFMIFIGCNFESRASQVGRIKIRRQHRREKWALILVSWFRVKKLECLEFITYEAVARSVASRPKKNSPLAKKLSRSTCM